jgi:hypothetical protein
LQRTADQHVGARVGWPRPGPRPLARDDLDDGFEVHADPRLLADPADADLDLPERGLDRGRAVFIGDGRRAASDEAARADRDALPATGNAVTSADDHGQQPLEEDVPVEG